MIIHCDKEVLDNNVVMDFLQKDDLCNIPDNTSKLMAPYSKDWTGPNAMDEPRELDPAELTREDQIYLQTAFELHHYWKSRMRALALTRTYEAEYDEVATKLNQVVEVSESLRKSVSLLNVLGLILDIGNYMNDSNKQASGFKLSSLARLGMVKDDKNESTFADLVERIVRNQYPEWEGFVEDIQGVVTAQKLNVEQLQQDAKRYIDNIKNVQMSLDSGNLSDPKKFHPQDRVAQVVLRCMKEARRKAEQMQLYLDEMTREYDSIMAFYGEDPSDENARRDFFAKIAVFVTEWKKSREKNTAYEETRKRNEASMARKRALLGPGTGLSANGEGSAPPSPGTGAMDSLLEKLRAAAPQAKDQRDRRRRARLQNKAQVRIASGQKIPDWDEIPEVEASLSASAASGAETTGGETETVTPADAGGSEVDDVAARAAALLQGMRSDAAASGNLDGATEEETSERRDSQRRARRRDNADEERKARRRRREQARSSTREDGQHMENGAIAEEAEAEQTVDESRLSAPYSAASAEDGDDGLESPRKQSLAESLGLVASPRPLPTPTPTTVVRPPTPDGEGSKDRPIELDD
jgi:cytokinesis protein